MLYIFSRHRPLALLASVVLAQILLLAFQIRRDRDVRLIRYWAVAVMTPAERAGTWSFSKVGGVWSGYIGLHNARTENERLRAELGELQLRNRDLASQAAEAQRLSLLLSFREAHTEAPMLAAQVIGASADSESHTLFINRGARDHLRANLGVVTPDGVVGKIVEVFPSTAQVLLINDKVSGVGALLAETRTHGVVKGSGDPDPRMDYVVNDEKVKPGATILTSGEDRIFPKGLLIGTVISTSQNMPFQIIRVQPAARLDRLEDLIVLLTQQELEPKEEPSYSVVPPASVEPSALPAGPAGSQSTASPKPPSLANGPVPKRVNPGASPAKPTASTPQRQASAKPTPVPHL
jgi:rod shape-determining protein MreC